MDLQALRGGVCRGDNVTRVIIPNILPLLDWEKGGNRSQDISALVLQASLSQFTFSLRKHASAKESQGTVLLLFHPSPLDLLAPFKDSNPTKLFFAGEDFLALTRKEIAISNQKTNKTVLSTCLTEEAPHLDFKAFGRYKTLLETFISN